MKVLHTSDWHLGRALYGKKRYAEFEAFLAWLLEVLQSQAIDALVVAGDVFDTTTPSNRAQELYYQFLYQVGRSSCRHVVVVAGNHDSPSFLEAPKDLLKALDVHVIGQISAVPDDDVLVLRDQDGRAELIVCAVPYLRDRDIRQVEAGESVQDKEQKLVAGIRAHYAAIAASAEQKQAALGGAVPILATGHLFTAGGQTIDGDGVRDLYVGSLAHVTAAMFPSCFDYLALGHLHVPQKVAGSAVMRYSGSPLAMSFGEATQRKIVCCVELTPTATSVETIDVPVFQALERIQGDHAAILQRISALAASEASPWVEVIYTGDSVIGSLQQDLEEIIAESKITLLRVRDARSITAGLTPVYSDETLADLTPTDVFDRLLDSKNIPEDDKAELRGSYQQALQALYDHDSQAE